MNIIRKKFSVLDFVKMDKNTFSIIIKALSEIGKDTKCGKKIEEWAIFIIRVYLIGLYYTPVRIFRDICTNDIVIDCVKKEVK